MLDSATPRFLSLLALSAGVLLGVPSESWAQRLSAEEQRIHDNVQANNAGAVALLERVVNINSGTLNSEGVRAVGAVFMEELDKLGFTTRWMTLPAGIERGGHLFATRQGSRGKRLLLIGHLDTVFEQDSPFQQFEVRGDTAYGPGASDMKGGDVVIVYALKALHDAGVLDGATITVALIGDEERPGGDIAIVRGDLIEAAERSDVALGFEGSVGADNATVARRGSSGWTLTTTGKAGHSGMIFSDTYGSGAILEAARILDAFREEVRGPKYLTFNPGLILGGTTVNYDQANARGEAFGKSNVIPQTVVVNGGLRFISEVQKGQAREKMRQIVAQNLPHTSAEISFSDSYPAMTPKPANDSLLTIYDEGSRALGYGPITPLDPRERGAADISFVADQLAALSGIGPHGRGAHSFEDQLYLESLPVATARAALLMYRLTR